VLSWYNARFDECERVLETSHQLRRQVRGDHHPDTLDTLERLAALAHYQLRDDDLAGERFSAAIAGLSRAHGADHVRVAVARRNHAAYLRDKVGSQQREPK
jgi:hypothetical protein